MCPLDIKLTFELINFNDPAQHIYICVQSNIPLSWQTFFDLFYPITDATNYFSPKYTGLRDEK